MQDINESVSMTANAKLSHIPQLTAYEESIFSVSGMKLSLKSVSLFLQEAETSGFPCLKSHERSE